MPVHDQLAQDLRDVLAWLEQRHHAKGDIWLHVMRAPLQPVGELSLVTVDSDRGDLDIGRVHGDLLTTLTVLGYRVAWPQDGADPEDVEVPSSKDMSGQERLACVARIEQAMGVVVPIRHKFD